MLTQVFQIRRLLDEAIDLHLRAQLLTFTKVLARQLLLDAREDLQGAGILHFLCVDVVVLRGSDGGAVAGAADDAGHLVRIVGVGVGGVGDHDGLPAFRGVVWFGRGVAVVEAPG
jgi:hypothetical protein